jgi:hypothetical protein
MRPIVSLDDFISRVTARHLPHDIGGFIEPALVLILTPPAIGELAIIRLPIVRAFASSVPVRRVR